MKHLESNRKPNTKLELNMRTFRGATLASALPEGWNFRDHTNTARGGWAFTSPDQQLSLYVFRGGIVRVTKGRLIDANKQEFLTQNEVKKVTLETSQNSDHNFHFKLNFKFGDGELSLVDQDGHYTGVLRRDKKTGILRRTSEEISRATIVVPKNPQ